MAPRVVPLAYLAVLASCATGTGSAGPDGGRADARIRADASAPPDGATGTPQADAAPESADASPTGEGLLITEIVDADLAGGLPKFVELTNLGANSENLGDFSLAIFSNGALTISGGASTQLSGTLAPGESHVINFENSDSVGSSSFFTVYGFDPDDMSFGAFINGNDTVVLYRGPATGDGSDATIVDIYGVVGTDGTGRAWEYLDGFATRRQASSTPSSVFAEGDWDFSGASALDGVDAAGIAAATSPGSH